MTEVYCDNCGVTLRHSEAHFYGSLPWDVASANEGESGILCSECKKSFQNSALDQIAKLDEEIGL
jgi:hypothetical protein